MTYDASVVKGVPKSSVVGTEILPIGSQSSGPGPGAGDIPKIAGGVMVRCRRFPAKTFLSAAISLAGALAVFVSPSAGGAAVMIMAANDPPPPKSAASDSATNSASKPMIIHNADGTFTVQKEPANGDSKDANGEKGLVIPPQVIVPEVRVPERK